MSEEKLRQLARKRAKFYIHLSIYIVVNILVFSIWYITLGPSGFPWFIFPLVGWGIAVLIHGVTTFYRKSLEDRMTERELSKLKAQESKKDEKE